MYIKDYYKTLELAPSAPMHDIKKAFRKMAQRYHPDKNDDPYAEANFAEIKEAYETLTDPVRKNQYLQERWYNRDTGNTHTDQAITPVNILKQSLEFEKYVSTLDVYRMDTERIYEFMNELLSSEVIGKLHHFNETEANRQIMHILLKPVKLLKSNRAAVIIDKLNRLTKDVYQNDLEKVLTQQKQKEKWESNKWIVVLLITILICLLIKFVA